MVAGSTISQRRITVGSSVKGSRMAVLSSGIRIMSDSLMPFHPEMDEPSNILPPSKKSSSTTLAGMETCCSFPLVSVNLRSTQRTSLLLIKLSVCSDIVLSSKAPGAPGSKIDQCLCTLWVRVTCKRCANWRTTLVMRRRVVCLHRYLPSEGATADHRARL